MPQTCQHCKIGSIDLKMIAIFGISDPKLGKYDTFFLGAKIFDDQCNMTHEGSDKTPPMAIWFAALKIILGN